MAMSAAFEASEAVEIGLAKGGLVSEARTGKRFPLELPIKIQGVDQGSVTGNMSAAGVLHNELDGVLQAAHTVRRRVVVVGDGGESAQTYMGARAHGVVYRSVPSCALVDCVRKVARGETWIQDIAVPSELSENDMVGLRVRDRLTAKELRIVALIVQGYKNKENATQLGTTEQVIKNYLRNVYDKIGVSDRLELALFTIHHRILNEAAAALAGTTSNQLSN